MFVTHKGNDEVFCCSERELVPFLIEVPPQFHTSVGQQTVVALDSIGREGAIYTEYIMFMGHLQITRTNYTIIVPYVQTVTIQNHGTVSLVKTAIYVKGISVAEKIRVGQHDITVVRDILLQIELSTFYQLIFLPLTFYCAIQYN